MATIFTSELLQPTRRFDCPCCGKQTIRDNGKPVAQPCEHFLFSHDSDRDDFTDCTAAIDALIESVPAPQVDPLDVDFIALLPADAEIHVIETRDHAAGPVIRTDVFAIQVSGKPIVAAGSQSPVIATQPALQSA